MKIYIAHPTSEMRVRNRNAYSLNTGYNKMCLIRVLPGSLYIATPSVFPGQIETSTVSPAASSHTHTRYLVANLI